MQFNSQTWLRIKVSSTYDGHRDFVKLFQLRKYVEATSKNILFDLSDCKFLKQNAVALLAGIIRTIENQGRQAQIDWHTCDGKVARNLIKNQFRAHFGPEIRRAHWSGNSIPFRHDIEKNKQAILSYLLERWLGPKWISLSDALGAEIAGVVWEIYENAFTHAESEIGVFTCGQHFPNKKQLSLTIADFGTGIAAQVQSFYSRYLFRLPFRADVEEAFDIMTESQSALKWAFQKGNSTKNRKTGGLGLHCLKELIRLNNGSMIVFSNDSYVKISALGEQYYRHNADFKGTVVNITFICDAHEKRYTLASEKNL